MFTHILCPTDLKERSQTALIKAVQIAHQFGSKITLLNVHDEFLNKKERTMLRVSVDDIKEKFQQTAIQAREEMREMVRSCHAERLDLDILLREGKPAKTIAKVAAEIQADLIVMCTDGKDNLGDFVTGTMTEYVINHSPCPVLVIPNKKTP